MAAHEMLRIADQLSRAVNGPAWHGPSLLETLRDVSATDAAARPLPSAHSIWELVAHTTAWLEIVRKRLDGTAPLDITDAMDWPPVAAPEPDAADESASRRWQSDLARLRRAAEDLQAAIDSQDDRRLADDLPGSNDTWTAYHTLHGVLQHTLYHTGQIAILKKVKP
jgi:uncharacterized damage-inducible protein DinB